MAWSHVVLAGFWKMPTTSRVSAGLRFSKVWPVWLATHSPAMKFLKVLVLPPVWTAGRLLFHGSHKDALHNELQI